MYLSFLNKRMHPPVHFVVRDDGNDGGDADAVCQAVPEEWPAGEPACLVKEQRGRPSSKTAALRSTLSRCVSACVKPTYSELYHRGQESTRSADAQQVVDC